MTRVQKQVPCQYMVNEPGYNYNINKVGLGYGTRMDFMRLKNGNDTPAPNRYDSHIKESISYQSVKTNPKTPYGFYNNYDKYEKICYHGMEHHFYLRESQGPGAYLPLDQIYDSKSRKAQQYSVPRNNRGLLAKSPQKNPGPTEYEDQAIPVRKQQQPRFKMPKATRDIPFSKYNAVHSELVRKGLV